MPGRRSRSPSTNPLRESRKRSLRVCYRQINRLMGDLQRLTNRANHLHRQLYPEQWNRSPRIRRARQ